MHIERNSDLRDLRIKLHTYKHLHVRIV